MYPSSERLPAFVDGPNLPLGPFGPSSPDVRPYGRTKPLSHRSIYPSHDDVYDGRAAVHRVDRRRADTKYTERQPMGVVIVRTRDHYPPIA